MTGINGRHFLQIPGPTNVPDRVLRAIDQPTIDHRGPEFQQLGQEVLAGMKQRFQDQGAGRDLSGVRHRRVGSRAGQHAVARRPRADVRDRPFRDAVAEAWRSGSGCSPSSSPATGATAPMPRAIEARLAEDQAHAIKAVCVVHNETSTGVTSRIGEVRKAIDRAKHPALLMVDTISSLASIDYRHDEWGVDVTVAGSQKGPDAAARPVVQRASATRRSRRRRPRSCRASYWALGRHARAQQDRLFPVHAGDQSALRPARSARTCCEEEGLDNVFARHDRHAEATRRAVRAWGLEILCLNPAEYRASLTAVLMPAGPRRRRASAKSCSTTSTCRSAAGWASSRARCSASATSATSTISTLVGTLAGVEMGLALAGVPHKKGGVPRRMDYLTEMGSVGRSTGAMNAA